MRVYARVATTGLLLVLFSWPRKKMNRGLGQSPVFNKFNLRLNPLLDIVSYFNYKGYLLQIWKIRKQIMVTAQGISVLGISKKNLCKIKFLIPCKEEQKKITSLMQNIDEKVANTVDQITQTQQFKKGLLQQMFV